MLDENSGSSVDWTYDELGVKYSFAVELRDQGEYGFLIPADQIIPNCKENWPFVLEVVESYLDAIAAGAPSLSSPLHLLTLAFALTTFFLTR